MIVMSNLQSDFRGKGPLFLERITYTCSAQFVNLRNFEIAPHKLEISKLHNYLYTVQSTAQFVNHLHMKQAIILFANEAREHFSSALEHIGTARKSLKG